MELKFKNTTELSDITKAEHISKEVKRVGRMYCMTAAVYVKV